ncbi:MAG: insulinase family protein [Desulfobacterales bacterium]|nr:insulinase family protein [Desulfobacterales bacterium]
MFKKFILILIAVLLTINISYSKTQAATTIKKKIWLSEVETDIDSDPTLIQGKLANGFRYFLKKNKKPKDRVSMHLVIEAGSMHEVENQRGLAHFLEHMLFNGSENFKPGELIKYFQKLGMDFGGDANAHTGFYNTVYDVVLPKGDKKSLSDGLLVLHDYANSALLLKSEIEKEKGIILSEKRERNSASFKTFEKVLNFELNNNLITRRIPIGTTSTIKNADRKKLKDYYDTWYRPEKMMIVMTGDFDVDEAKGLIEKKFQSLKERATRRDIGNIEKVFHKGVLPFYHYESESAATNVKIEILYNESTKNDSVLKQRELLINYIGDSILQNRIKSITGKKDTPFSSAYVSSGSFLKRYKYATISAKTKSKDWEKSLLVIEQMLRTAQIYGFTNSEFQRVKKEILSYYINQVKSSKTRDSIGLSRSIIRSISEGNVYQSPNQELKLYELLIKNIDSTIVSRNFKNKWKKNHRLIMVTGNAKVKGSNKEVVSKIRGLYNKSLQVAVRKPIAKKDVVFPYIEDPLDDGKIRKRVFNKKLGIHTILFENGNVLNLKKTKYSENEILFNVIFGNGKSTEPKNKPGITEIAVSVMNESGLNGLDRDSLERAFTGKNTSLSLISKETYFMLTGKSVSSELNLLFRLTYAYINDMGFRDDAFSHVLGKYKQSYEALQKTVDGVTALKANKFFAGNDRRFGFTDYKTISGYKLHELKSYLSDRLHETPFEVSIVGDFNIDEAILFGRKFIGTLPKIKKKQLMADKMIVFPSGQIYEEKVKTKINKGKVIISFPTADFWDIKRTRRLSVLSAVLSNRLHDIIREKKSIAYSPYAYNSPSLAYKGFGYLKVVIGINPKDVSLVLNEVQKITDDLNKNGIREDEFRRALDPILTSIKDYRKKNSYWIRGVLTGSSRHPEKFIWSKSFLDDFKKIKLIEINKLARKYFDNKKQATFIVVPE